MVHTQRCQADTTAIYSMVDATDNRAKYELLSNSMACHGVYKIEHYIRDFKHSAASGVTTPSFTLVLSGYPTKTTSRTSYESLLDKLLVLFYFWL